MDDVTKRYEVEITVDDKIAGTEGGQELLSAKGLGDAIAEEFDRPGCWESIVGQEYDADPKVRVTELD